MDDFLNILRRVGKKPGFYLTPKNDGNSKSTSHLRTFIVGIQVGQHLKHDTSILEGFTEWVCHRYGVAMGARDWSGHILERAGGDEVTSFGIETQAEIDVVNAVLKGHHFIFDPEKHTWNFHVYLL